VPPPAVPQTASVPVQQTAADFRPLYAISPIVPFNLDTSLPEPPSVFPQALDALHHTKFAPAVDASVRRTGFDLTLTGQQWFEDSSISVWRFAIVTSRTSPPAIVHQWIAPFYPSDLYEDPPLYSHISKVIQEYCQGHTLPTISGAFQDRSARHHLPEPLVDLLLDQQKLDLQRARKPVSTYPFVP
jgi:hypothetical protein